MADTLPWEDFSSTKPAVEEGPWNDFKGVAVAPPPDESKGTSFTDTINSAFNPKDILKGYSDELSDVGEVGSKASEMLGKSVATVANIPTQVYNAGAAMTHAYAPREIPFGQGKGILPTSLYQAAEDTIASGGGAPGVHPEPALEGLSKSGRKVLEGFTTPESIATLPLFEFRAGKAAMLGMMAASTPKQIENAHAVLNDPDSTTAQKWEALGDAGIQLAMTTALALHLKPEQVKAAITPEDAAKQVDKQTTPERKVPNASRKQETTEINGDVQPQPVEGQGQVPDQESGGGVQPQTQEIPNEIPLTSEPPPAGQQTPQPATELPAPIVAVASETPMNPGGALKDLPPELQAKSNSVKDQMAAEFEKLKANRKNTQIPKPVVDQSVKNPETPLVGMGGAVPSEFEKSPQTPTGIKNATVDVERAKRGLPAAIAPVRKAFGEVWDKAMARIDQDPGSQDRLMDELREKPRALTDEEDAMLLHRQIDLQNDYGKATRDAAQAHEDGNAEMAQEAKLRTARLSDQLLDLYNINKSVGTETGRGLNARKMMAYEDFSLAQMELSKRAANDGKPLTDTQRAEIQSLHDQIAKTQQAHDDYVAKTGERISKLESDAAIDRIRREGDKPQFNPKVIEAAQKIVSRWDKAADESREALKKMLGRTSINLDPTVLYHVARIGRSYLGHAALDIAAWSEKMVSEFGDSVKPYLNDAYAKAQSMVNEETKGAQNPLDAMREMRGKSPEEQIKANSQKIGEKIKSGKKNDITWYVQRIARLFVDSGIKDREKLIDAVHGVLREHLPDITRRDTMDAISGYGDYKQLTKDQLAIQLRGMKGEMQQLAKLEDMAKGESPLKSGVERRTPTEVERQLIKKVNDAKFAFQVPMTDPATQLKSALDTYKTNLKNRAADYQDRIDRGDYSRLPRRELKLDETAMRLKAENERVKQRFQQGLNRDRLAKRSAWEKSMDTLVKWRRGFILSGPVTLAKLTTAAMARAIITPIEEGVGAGIGAAFPKLAERASRESGFNLKAETKAITEGITTGMKDAWSVLRTGKGTLDLVHGKDPGLPQSFIDIFGNIHGALKAPIKRAEFSRAFQKRADFYAKQGVDITDPFVQTRIGLESYQDANRAIFMQKNIINDAYKRALGSLDQPAKGQTSPSIAKKITGTTARVLMPIVKVPLNIVGETMQYAIGSVTGSARLAKAYRAGIEQLKPEEADLIMRQLKKGSLGGAVMLLGFLNPKVLGGFYQQGDKRDKKDIPPDAARVEGVNIPPSVIHNPWMSAAQIGATVRRVSDSKLRKSDKETQGLSHGAMAGAFGLAEATPFVREMQETVKAFNPHERDRWLGELTKSLAVPQGVQSLAQYLDKNAKGEPVKRDPKNPLQSVETGLPYLRQNVPVKK